MPIHDPKIGGFGVKVGEMEEMETFCSFIPQGIQYPETDAPWIKQHKNHWCGFGSRREQKFGYKKKKNNPASVTFQPFAQTPTVEAMILNCGMWDEKNNHQPGSGILEFWHPHFSIGLAGRPYNSVRTTVLSHTRMVVRECCKGDDESQWETGKFDPPPPKNPLTDGHQNLYR